MAPALPSRHSSCTQFSAPPRARCRRMTRRRVSSASRTKAGTVSTHFKLRALSFCFCPKRPGGPPLEARFTAPAYARDHLDEVGVAKEHRLFEVSVAAFQSVALQEMLLKLKFSFTFGSIITPRRKRSQEPISKDIGQNVCVSVGRCLQEESPAPSQPA